MPRKPKHPCAYPGCPELVESGERFCETHRKRDGKTYEKYKRGYDTHKRYGRAWKRIRDAYIKSHPLCEECLKDGRYVKADEVHHVLPIAEGGTHDRRNLMALCKSCHSRIHMSERNKKDTR